MDKQEELVKKFYEIKQRGWIVTHRHGDQCLGNTFEDLIGKEEDNKSEADFHGIELKSHRTVTKSMVSLFSKSPSYPKGVNTYLRETYGVIEETYGKKVLNTTISGNKFNSHRGGHGFKAFVDRKTKRIFLQICDLENGKIIDDEIYWSFSILETALNMKLQKIAIFYGDEKNENGKCHVRYTKMVLIEGITLDGLLTAIEQGKLLIDIRIGVYASGKNAGKTHDHGTAFRIHLEDLLSTYGKATVFD